LSENIRVRSILGRFLEHSRIYAFANTAGPAIDGGPNAGPEVFIGSADLMHRNLDRRVEALIRVADPGHISELLDLLEVSMSSKTSSWCLLPQDTWERHNLDADGKPLADLQSVLIRRHSQRREPAL
jgi:polyphosphate kinase